MIEGCFMRNCSLFSGCLRGWGSKNQSCCSVVMKGLQLPHCSHIYLQPHLHWDMEKCLAQK